MSATASQIRGWFKKGQEDPLVTHMIVKCDGGWDDDCCFPVYVRQGGDARTVSAKYGCRAMECYSMALDLEFQMSEHRANHWD